MLTRKLSAGVVFEEGDIPMLPRLPGRPSWLVIGFSYILETSKEHTYVGNGSCFSICLISALEDNLGEKD